MGLYELERVYSAGDALDRLKGVCRELEVRAHVDFQSKLSQVTHLHLLDKGGRVVSAGSGKGKNHYIGSMAESIEHFSLESYIEEVKESDLLNVVAQQGFSNDHILKSLVSEVNPKKVSTTLFRDLQQNDYDVPVAEVNPLWNRARTEIDFILKKYGTNSGVSFGCSPEEAILHGINEAIERHCISELYLEILGFKERTKWFRSMEEKGFGDLSGKVHLLHKKTNFGNYIVVAISGEGWPYRISQVSGGCSMFFSLAKKRAIDEFKQIIELYGEGEALEDQRTVSCLSEYPRLRHILNFREQDLLVYESNPEQVLEIEGVSISTQLQRLIKKLEDNGYKVLYRMIKSFSNECCVTQVFVPGLERFNLIRTGLLVAPQLEI